MSIQLWSNFRDITLLSNGYNLHRQYVLFSNNYFIIDDNMLSIILDTKGEEQ